MEKMKWEGIEKDLDIKVSDRLKNAVRNAEDIVDSLGLSDEQIHILSKYYNYLEFKKMTDEYCQLTNYGTRHDYTDFESAYLSILQSNIDRAYNELFRDNSSKLRK